MDHAEIDMSESPKPIGRLAPEQVHERAMERGLAREPQAVLDAKAAHIDGDRSIHLHRLRHG